MGIEADLSAAVTDGVNDVEASELSCDWHIIRMAVAPPHVKGGILVIINDLYDNQRQG